MVASSRKRPVLYELIRKDRASGATAWRAPAQTKPVLSQPATQPVTSRGAPETAGGGLQAAIPSMTFDVTERGLQVSINATAAILVALVLLGVVWGAFALGMRAGGGPKDPSSSVRDTPTTQPRQPDRSAVPPRSGGSGENPASPAPGRNDAPKGDGGAPDASKTDLAPPKSDRSANPPDDAEPPPVVELKSGYHYLVVQHFRKADLEPSRSAAAYLADNGIPCAIDRSGSDIRLIALEAFLIDQKDPGRRTEQQRANDLIKRVKQLGKEYRRTGGYDFSGCELRQHK